MIGINSEKGQCKGNAYTNENDRCLDTIGYKWNYHNGKKWQEAKHNLGLRCQNSNELLLLLLLRFLMLFVGLTKSILALVSLIYSLGILCNKKKNISPSIIELSNT